MCSIGGAVATINAVGGRIVVGAPFGDGGSVLSPGLVQVWELNNTTVDWFQLGGDIVSGDGYRDFFGMAVPMNALPKTGL